MIQRSLQAITLLLWTAATPAGTGSSVRVDLSQGVVDGHKAISFWAVEGIDSKDLVDPSDYTVRMVPAEDLDRTLTEAAGRWLLPRPGKYKFWLEGPGRMTPFSSVFNFRLEPFEGRGIAAVLPVEPAGIVALAEEVETVPSAVLRLLHLDSHRRGSYPSARCLERSPATRSGRVP